MDTTAEGHRPAVRQDAPPTTSPTMPSARRRIPRVRMEARKLLDTRAPRVLTGLSVLGGALMAILVPLFTDGPMTPADLTTAALSVGMYLLPVVAILAVAVEWGKNATGLVTFTLDPRRTSVLAAKVVALVGLAAVVVAISYVVAAVGAAVSGNEFVDVGGWLAGAGWRVLGISGLLILAGAIAAAVQSTVMAVVAVLLLPQLVPQILMIFEATARLAPYTDVQSGLFPMVSGVAPLDWSTFEPALVLWILVPGAIGVWRGARGNVG